MKVAVIGSRNLLIKDLARYLPEGVAEIISGGARGVDTCAKEFAIHNHIAYREFLPDYVRFQRGAPLKRNKQIVEYADLVIAFWDGKSRGTRFTIEYCRKVGKLVKVIEIKE